MLASEKRTPQWLMAGAVFATIVLFYTVAAVRFPMVYIWATYEDLFGEWIQFWCLVVSFVLAARLCVPRWRFRWFFVALACACFYAAMEEISWGQRIFNFSSPAYFKARNLQGETNLHNFLTGPYATPLKAGITYALSAALLCYGLVYPVALRSGWRLARWLHTRGMAAPPLYAFPFFIGGAILEVGPFRFNEGEVAEVLVGVGLVLMTVQYACCKRMGLAEQETTSGRSLLTACATSRQGMALALIVALSVGTTTAVYASTEGRTRIDKRIRAGVKKFAGRYERYERWDVAADFYGRLLVEDPKNVYFLRRLAETYENMGDATGFERTANQAVAIDLARYRRSPDSAAVNRSLARTYRMIGDDAQAEVHMQAAFRLCSERVERYPESANAAYSLGKTYTLLGRHGAALEQISRARRLDPASKRIRKAYFRAKRKLAAL